MHFSLIHFTKSDMSHTCKVHRKGVAKYCACYYKPLYQLMDVCVRVQCYSVSTSKRVDTSVSHHISCKLLILNCLKLNNI